MRRYSTEQACAASGATLEELAEFRRAELLVPNVDRWPPWKRREPYYTEQQVEVLRWLIRTRRRRPD